MSYIKSQLAIISRLYRFFGKVFLSRRLIQQRNVQNPQHFVGIFMHFQAMLHDSHHAVSSTDRLYQDSYSSIRRTQSSVKHVVSFLHKSINISDVKTIEEN